MTVLSRGGKEDVMEGQNLAEYGLLVGFIAVIIAVAVITLGMNLEQYFATLTQAIENLM